MLSSIHMQSVGMARAALCLPRTIDRVLSRRRLRLTANTHTDRHAVVKHGTSINKAVIDRRLCPRCCHLESYFKRLKSSPVSPLACSWYYCTVYSQAQGCVCTALQLGGDVEQPWLMSKYDVIHKTVTHHYVATGGPSHGTNNMHKKFGKDRTCSFKVMIVDRQTCSSQYSAPQSGRSKYESAKKRGISKLFSDRMAN